MNHLLLTASNNPFLSLPPTFRAKHDPAGLRTQSSDPPEGETKRSEGTLSNPVVRDDAMFGFAPEEIKTEWLMGSRRFQAGIQRLGETLNGGRA